MLKIGITGGIGSGKSTVAAMFQVLGIPVYYADKEAKKLMAHDPDVRQKLIEAFGEQSFLEGVLNRSFISELVFSHPEKLTKLNGIVHPAVGKDFEKWCLIQEASYVLKEAALLFEAGSYLSLDFIIGVYCPEVERIRRVIKRDGIDEQQVLLRMRNQMDEAKKMKRCNAIVYNDELHAIIPQVLALHEVLIQKAG